MSYNTDVFEKWYVNNFNRGAEPVGFVQGGGLEQLSKGHPAKIYPKNVTPSPLEPHTLVYTRPQPAKQGSVPEGWSLTHIDDPATDGYLIKGPGISYCAWKDKEPWLYLFCEALAATLQPKDYE